MNLRLLYLGLSAVVLLTGLAFIANGLTSTTTYIGDTLITFHHYDDLWAGIIIGAVGLVLVIFNVDRMRGAR